MDLKGKNFLICQPIMYGINGSTMVTLELAEYLNKIADVTVYTTLADSPARDIFEERNITVTTFDENPEYSLEDFDIVWTHSQILPKSLIRKMNNFESAKKIPKFIFLHMSPFENFSDERPWIYDLENRIADKVLCISEEVKKEITPYLDKKIVFYRNPSPDSFVYGKEKADRIKKVLIVSNHCPKEVLEAKKILTEKYDVEVKILGESGSYEPITEILVREFDTVITIGKTVQMCLLSNIPVYIYDHFGGDGYLKEENYESNKYTNFSGRNNHTIKTPEKIAEEIVNDYIECFNFIEKNREAFIEEFSLSKNLNRIFKDITITPKKNFDNEYIRYVETSQNIARHSMYYGGYDSYRQKRENQKLKSENETLKNENKKLYDEVTGIKNSKTYKFAKKLSSLIKRKK